MLKRIGIYAAIALVLSALAAAAVDSALFMYRQRHGTALGSITVREYLATPLKNGRDELDFLGESDQPCVHALLPHQNMPACWWLSRHKDHWVQS